MWRRSARCIHQFDREEAQCNAGEMRGRHGIPQSPTTTSRRCKIKEQTMSYYLSMVISGEGKDPKHRSHWAFAIHQPAQIIGDLLHVRPIDLRRLWYEFEHRSDSELILVDAIGLAKIAELDGPQRLQAISVIRDETAPKDGVRRCQDWVFSALIALEVEELVPAGTSELWKGLMGRTATEVEEAVGPKWTSFRGSHSSLR
ncbi:hypothetical protein BDV37DRAFT_272451 [Aspergillus pseudonomiae]|uniref:Uncharacterized protein n=2 Tax=Aspergillus subgen. Circumdati TaxID=2720871 RepID=A0A5N7D8V6_9EURO|nr:uncharacterized protein BDV37DRAFT_272451 [Aspergillus pseudonomiae]KAE8402882.1 hypothetical protein BDV37DRAFT_272451 [Aspergillus pseudonomiae]